jgi:SM-20-related protein
MYVQIFDDFLLDSDIAPVTQLIQENGYKFGWPSNKKDTYGHWNLMFAGEHYDNREDVTNQLPIGLNALWSKIQQAYLPSYTVIRAYSNAYTYGTEGYVHTDSSIDTDLTVLIYLNEELWNRDWAGETVFFDDNDIVKAVLPKFKRIVIFPSNIDHVARSVSRACTVDRRILTFKARLTSDSFFVPAETRSIQHTGRTLDIHLSNTKKLLDDFDVPEYVKVAAGIHSIYGTNSFETATFDIAVDRLKVQQAYGIDAENLAYLFCTLNRPKCLETEEFSNWRDKITVTITDEELEYLRLIEAANLIEQKASLESCPKIYATWAKYQKQKISI